MAEGWNIPLHPEDVARARLEHDAAVSAASQVRSQAFDAELARLRRVAEYKNYLDRKQRGGPVDSEWSYGQAVRLAGQDGYPSPSESVAYKHAAESLEASQPADSRNPLLHYLSVPHSAVLNAAKAFSSPGEYGGPETTGEFFGQLAAAVPGAVWPPAGYPSRGAEVAFGDYAAANPVQAGMLAGKLAPYELTAVTAPVRAAARRGGDLLERLRYGAPGIETYIAYPGSAETRVRNSYSRGASPLAPLLLR